MALASRRSTALALVALAALAGCGDGGGSGGSEREARRATLVLDFLPNAVHVGIYRALARGYYERGGLDLRVIQPTSTADTLKLIDAGRAELGIADATDVAGQIARGRGAKAVMALVQRPLGGVIALRRSGIRSPAQLEGRTVGITGVPSDEAVLDTVVESAGGDPDAVRTVTIGFNGVQALEGGRIAAFTGFVAADGTQVEQDGFPVTAFPLDEHGGPRYPGLVAFSTEERIADDPELVRAFVEATVRGYEEALEDPAAALDDLLAQVRALRRPLARAQLAAYLPLFRANAPAFGVLRRDDVEALSRFMVERGLLDEPIPPERYGTDELLPGR